MSYRDWPEIVIGGLIALVVLFAVVALGCFVRDEIQWANTPGVACRGKLISQVYEPAKTGTGVGVMSNGKVGTIVTTTSESRVTVWDLGRLGRVECEDETVFRYAQPEATLYIKVRGDRVRIVGINR